MDPEVATAIHDERTLSPYSTSPLETVDSQEIFYGVVNPGVVVRFRITALRNSLADMLSRFFVGPSSPVVRLRDVSVRVAEVAVESFDQTQLNVCEESRYEVLFRTPTFFRNTQKELGIIRLLPRRLRRLSRPVKPVYRYVILPDPYLFFRNLARLYRQFCSPNFPYKSYCEWLLDGGVALETYRNLQVYKIYDSDSRWYRGFVGRAVFTVPKDLYDKKMARITRQLLEFSRFSNVGGNRTAGFGVVHYRVLRRGRDE
ncbi:MAG: CRISPR system precrRNA processing endoribonuclease RAMP protein Cas6 [Candidatus Caldarchaeum sp.]